MPRKKLAATRAVYSYAGLGGSEKEIRFLARANLAYTLGYYHRLACLTTSQYRRHLYTKMVPEIDALQDAAREGRGVVLLSAHMGDFDAAGAWLSEVARLTPVVSVDRLPSAVRQAFFCRTREASGVRMREREFTQLAHLAAELDRGRLVLLMVDRRTQGQTVPVDFLGRQAAVPAAAITLVQATGSLLVSGATWRNHQGANVLWSGTGRTVSRNRGIAEGQLQAAVDELSAVVRATPHQFHVPADVAQMSWLARAELHLPHCTASRVRPFLGARNAQEI